MASSDRMVSNWVMGDMGFSNLTGLIPLTEWACIQGTAKANNNVSTKEVQLLDQKFY